MMNKRLKMTSMVKLFILTSFILLFTGCYNKPSKPATKPPVVTTAVIKQQDVPVYIDAIGQVISTVTVNIRPQVAGKLIAAYIQQGAIVKEGDVLYEIDPRPYQAVLDEAKAQLAHDQALLEYANQAVTRYKKVVNEEYISIFTYEQYLSNAAAALAQVELDKASIAAAQLNVDFCKIVAPVMGKISYFNVDVGNIMAVDDPNQITVIRPFSPIDITFSLPQQQFEQVRKVQGNGPGWPFTAALPESPKVIYNGATFFIDNQIDQDTGTILFKGRLPNVDRELWPGEFIRVKVLHKIAPQALTVPPGAVLMGKDGAYIYTVDKEGKAVADNVSVITRTEEYIAIESSRLHAGDAVIIDGQINIAPGIKVNAKIQSSDSTPAK